MATVRWVKILAWFSTFISGWSFIGGLLFFSFFSPAWKIYIEPFGVITIILEFTFLFLSTVVLGPIATMFPIFQPNIFVLFYALIFVLLMIFIGSIYLIRRK